MNCGKTELTIRVNDVQNKLTCKQWKYYNEYTIFDYVFPDINSFKLSFDNGNYLIGDFTFYLIDYNSLIHYNVDRYYISEQMVV